MPPKVQCKYFGNTGGCWKGQDCSFLHGNPAQYFPPGPPFFQANAPHFPPKSPQTPLHKPPGQVPCKYDVAGQACPHFPNCKFMHNGNKQSKTLDDITQQMGKMAINEQQPSKQKKGPSAMKLFCGSCGKSVEWDLEESRLKAKRDSDGNIIKTKAGRIVFTGSQEAKCKNCDCLVMINPMCAVCAHCDAELGHDWKPWQWKCINVDGKAKRRSFGAKASKHESPCPFAQPDIGVDSKATLHGAIATTISSAAKHGGVLGWVVVH
mmetsp:Transcript_11269/g.13306  ORF Transcript_11269/g.13306 Transcript_11269/m.13306 type:complete len:265 (+) Transcript_11269:290-1084(+)